VLVSVVDFFSNLTGLLCNTSLQVIQDYLIHSTVFSIRFKQDVPILSLDSTYTASIKEIKGTRRNDMRKPVDFLAKEDATSADDKQQTDCAVAVNGLLSDFIGLLFNIRIVDQTVIDAIHTVTYGIQNELLNSIDGLSWVDAVSKQNIIKKLESIIQVIGHPNKLERYRGVFLDPNNFLDNIFQLNEFKFNDTMTSVGQPFNRSDYEFDATEVNAFYSPFTNTINFPAGILESPMFSSSFPKILQYARMGYVIGHETTHGFDNNGRLWNGNGSYFEITDPTSSKLYDEESMCLVNQFNNYYVQGPDGPVYVDGFQTLGENIADLGGVKNAFRGYKAWENINGPEFADYQVVPTLNNDQLFFVMLGQTWCTKATPAGLVAQIGRDVHSPSKFRVNGPLSNFDQFASTFKCSSSSTMVHSPKCSLW